MSSLKDFVANQKAKRTPQLSAFLNKSALNGVADWFSSKLSGDEIDPKDELTTVEVVNNSTANGKKTHSDPEKSSWMPTKFLSSEDAFGLSRVQRLIGFCCCLAAGIFCYVIAGLYIPVLVFKARKFGALYTLGSCFFLFSFALLLGPTSYVKHLMSRQRLPITLCYGVSLIATLYCSLWIRSTILTVVCAGAQIFALLWFVVSYVPGGESGLKFISKICGKVVYRTAQTVPKTLPI